MDARNFVKKGQRTRLDIALMIVLVGAYIGYVFLFVLGEISWPGGHLFSILHDAMPLTAIGSLCLFFVAHYFRIAWLETVANLLFGASFVPFLVLITFFGAANFLRLHWIPSALLATLPLVWSLANTWFISAQRRKASGADVAQRNPG